MKWLLLIPFFICANVEASNVAICEADGTFIKYVKSVNTPDFNKDPNNLINPDFTPCEFILRKYCKCVGRVLEEMSTAEKSAVDSAEMTAKKALNRAQARQGILNPSRSFEALLLAIVDQFKAAGLSITLDDIKTAAEAKVNAGDVD